MPSNYNAKYTATGPTPVPVTYYDILQVSPHAEQAIIESAYRKLALKFHPDLNPTREAYEKMQSLNKAYATLKDAQRRADYDRLLEELASERIVDDFSEDDYEPPPLQKYTDWLTKLVWVAVLGVALALIVTLFGEKQTKGNPQPSPTPVASQQVFRPPANAIFWDDFESVASANWNLGSPWHVTTRYPASGRYSLWFGDETTGRYPASSGAVAALLHPVDLSKSAKAVLHFKLVGQSDHNVNPSGEDRLFVEAATPGNDFQTVFVASGLYANWQDIAVDLGRWQGQAVLLRFRFSSGAINSGAGFSGFFIDDVWLETAK